MRSGGHGGRTGVARGGLGPGIHQIPPAPSPCLTFVPRSARADTGLKSRMLPGDRIVAGIERLYRALTLVSPGLVTILTKNWLRA